MDYTCPNCGHNIAEEIWRVTCAAEHHVEDKVDTVFNDNAEEDFEEVITCPQCKSPLTVTGTASASVEITTDSDVDAIKANVPKGWTPPSEVVEAFFEKTPDEVTFTEARCSHCHRLESFDASKTVRELMAEGWRITPIFPTYGIRCPDC